METMFQLVNKYLRAQQAKIFYTGERWFTWEENDSNPPPHRLLTTGPCKRHAVASDKVVPSFCPHQNETMKDVGQII